ncbi:hypothetical protein ACFV9C_27605 [Kribbella sp. NPDC059898]|uniref:hypothetical protein n=1 Tax=Kribbella sp. NPDC059898 TaxID=3346995 RepID=UPI003647DCD5
MTYFIAGNTAVENARSLSQSALPNAPQQYDEPRTPARTRRPVHGPSSVLVRTSVRARIGAVLRAAAEREVRLADRIDPTCTIN